MRRASEEEKRDENEGYSNNEAGPDHEPWTGAHAARLAP